IEVRDAGGERARHRIDPVALPPLERIEHRDPGEPLYCRCDETGLASVAAGGGRVVLRCDRCGVVVSLIATETGALVEPLDEQRLVVAALRPIRARTHEVRHLLLDRWRAVEHAPGDRAELVRRLLLALVGRAPLARAKLVGVEAGVRRTGLWRSAPLPDEAYR